jgi:hypothetical protein
VFTITLHWPSQSTLYRHILSKNLILIITLGEKLKLWSSSLSSFLHCPIISFRLGPNTILSNLSPYTSVKIHPLISETNFHTNAKPHTTLLFWMRYFYVFRQETRRIISICINMPLVCLPNSITFWTTKWRLVLVSVRQAVWRSVHSFFNPAPDGGEWSASIKHEMEVSGHLQCSTRWRWVFTELFVNIRVTLSICPLHTTLLSKVIRNILKPCKFV